jgi:hypothetical protein
MEMSLPTLKEFQDQCRKHDMTYYHSDDHSIYLKGRKQQEAIQKVVREGGRDYLDILIKEMEKQGV